MTFRPATLLVLPLVAGLGLSACGDDTDEPPAADSAEVISYRERMTKLDDALNLWAEAEDVATAHAGAEAAANLVVGSNGPDFGDRDGDGEVVGNQEFGLLPGLDGTPPGIAELLEANACIAADVLGGPWDDPQGRWDEMSAAIDAWTPENNTMPSLASHPMRIVGWATFTLASDSLEEAHEYAGHARIHHTVSMEALDCPA